MTLRVSLITRLPELEKLSAAWSELFERADSATPFQTPEWILPWIRNFGSGKIRAFAFSEGSRLVGLVPLYLASDPGDGNRWLRFIGTGNSDYLDLLAEKEFARACATAALNELTQRLGEWDFCELQELPETSPLLKVGAPAGFTCRISVQDTCPWLPLPETHEELVRIVPSSVLERLAYYRRRADRHGGWVARLADKRTFGRFFDEFVRLHRARWGDASALVEDRSIVFLRASAEGLLSKSRLRLLVLEIGGRPASALLGFLDRARCYFYLGGFDPQFARFDPGTLVLGSAIDLAIREKARTFDFLRGEEHYKYAWGARKRLNYRMVLHA